MSTGSTGRESTNTGSKGGAPATAGRTSGQHDAAGPAPNSPSTGGTAASGRRGETLAAEHLERLGWRILDRNWRCSAGEIDLIAHDPLEDALVFVEVKYRTGTGYGSPLEAITYAKRMHLRAVAAVWLREHAMALPAGTRVRIDGLGIVKQPGLRAEFTHVRGLS